jgi:predicted nucleic-acid-binding Zn-ribbon protein
MAKPGAPPHFRLGTSAKMRKNVISVHFYLKSCRKCAYAPVYGKTEAKNVKTWSVCSL